MVRVPLIPNFVWFRLGVLAVFLAAMAVVVAWSASGVRADAPEVPATIKLIDEDGAAGDEFGRYVGIYESTVVVTAMKDDGVDGHAINSGSLSIFERNLGGHDNWGVRTKIFNPDAVPYSAFGFAVSFEEDTVVVGAPVPGVPPGGALGGRVYIFERDLGGPDAWGLRATLTSPGPGPHGGDTFGVGLTINGDTLTVGASGADVSGLDKAGAAYVYERNLGGANAWGLRAQVVAPVPQRRARFGHHVWLSGDTALVTAYRENRAFRDTGVVYVLERNAPVNNGWGVTAEITSPAPFADQKFGRQLEFRNGVAVIGAQLTDKDGIATYIFGRDLSKAGGWRLRAPIEANAVTNKTNRYSLDEYGGTLAFGHRLDGGSGKVWVFERDYPSAGAWGVRALLVPPADYDGNAFGYDTDIWMGTIVVGANGERRLGNRMGAAYVFPALPPTS